MTECVVSGAWLHVVRASRPVRAVGNHSPRTTHLFVNHAPLTTQYSVNGTPPEACKTPAIPEPPDCG